MPQFDINPIDEDAINKEVWNTVEIEAKTELTPKQIDATNRLQVIGTIFNNAIIDNTVRGFMIKQKSLNRKSMGEFVDITKARNELNALKKNSPLAGLLG